MGITVLLLAVAVSCSVSCQRFHKDEKFRHAIAQNFEYPPGRVVDVVEETIDALRLRVLSTTSTHIDGRYEVRSAIGDEYRILVEGLRTDRTRIEIDMPSRRNQDQARLIMTEISSRMRFSRPSHPVTQQQPQPSYPANSRQAPSRPVQRTYRYNSY